MTKQQPPETSTGRDAARRCRRVLAAALDALDAAVFRLRRDTPFERWVFDRMDDRARHKLGSKPRFLYGASGLTTWRSRPDLVQARRRWRGAAGGLLAVAALCLETLFGGADMDTVIGALIFGGIALVPALYASVRAARLSRQIYDVDRLSDQEQTDAALALSRGDELLRRLSRLVESLDPGPLRDAGSDALHEAGEVVELRSKLVHRLTQLGGVTELMADQAADGPVGRAVTACRAQIADLERALDELAESVARLVDAAGAGRLRDELGELRDATERIALMAAAMTELELGTITDTSPNASSVAHAPKSRENPGSREQRT